MNEQKNAFEMLYTGYDSEILTRSRKLEKNVEYTL